MILTKLPFMSFPARQQLSNVFYYFAIYCFHLLQAQSMVSQEANGIIWFQNTSARYSAKPRPGRKNQQT